MPEASGALGEWLVLVQHELLLFAGVFFLIGALDEFAVDLIWFVLRVTGRARTVRLSEEQTGPAPLAGEAAVFIAAWREAGVIGATIRHALSAWPHADMRLYVGTYRNDPLTAEAVIAAADHDPRLRLVIHDCDGPSTKADCLNRLYRALEADEDRVGRAARMVVMHDAEDMVDPAALGLLDEAISSVALAQIPVLPEPLPQSRWVASHYCEEFAEAHGKGMVVRDALGAGIPAAGVGCAIARETLLELAARRGRDGPFAAECLTEDYELGLGVAALGRRSKFLRFRHPDGRLVATRACFPADVGCAVRQKSRWIHGIALQSWDRLGWSSQPADLWMRVRDRRGPLTALVLAVAYFLILIASVGWLAHHAGYAPSFPATPLVTALIAANTLSFVWRGALRFAFTAREYGWLEGVRAVIRIPLANAITILAGRRAFFEYLGSLRGRAPRWNKTRHIVHPALGEQRSLGI
ncbi:glycosyl transferase family protein [Tsuneonella sp. SYSU-LHT278]|uniref:glycosyl transferase family protein n=1 Tax=Tsuneonella sediminis TaxID=3416089 RepID=UPI003F797C66